MQIRNVVSTLALVACTLAPITSSAASLFDRSDRSDNPSSISAVKVKTVKLTLKNKSAAPMTLIVNDQPMTLEANAQTEVKAAEGSNIFGEDRTTLKVHVTKELGGNTVSFR